MQQSTHSRRQFQQWNPEDFNERDFSTLTLNNIIHSSSLFERTKWKFCSERFHWRYCHKIGWKKVSCYCPRPVQKEAKSDHHCDRLHPTRCGANHCIAASWSPRKNTTKGLPITQMENSVLCASRKTIECSCWRIPIFSRIPRHSDTDVDHEQTRENNQKRLHLTL